MSCILERRPFAHGLGQLRTFEATDNYEKSMNLRSVGPWAAFALASGLTALARESLAGSKWYYAFLAALMMFSVVLAARLLRQTKLKAVPIAVVSIGFLLGQWWFVEALILRAFWSINGFAP
jgi:hypothetical protein